MQKGMLQESVIIEYGSTDREVFVDGKRCGVTNQLITIETGSHTFDLGPPITYSPSTITRLVYGTSPQTPLVIIFTPEL